MVDPNNSTEARLVQSMADELPPGRGCTPALVFHGLRGRCIRDNDSPSWYNPNEVNQVYAYINKLMAKNVRPWDIGVITFYAKQVNQQSPVLTNRIFNLVLIADFQNEGTAEIQWDQRRENWLRGGIPGPRENGDDFEHGSSDGHGR